MNTFVLTTLYLTVLTFGWSDCAITEKHLLNSLVRPQIEKDGNSAATSYMDTLVKECINKLKSELKSEEPYPIPNLPTQEISDKNVQVNITLTNVEENNASSVVITTLKSSLLAMTETFDVTFPELEIFGNYTIKGKILKKSVHGTGFFHVWVTNLRTWGKAYLHLVDGYVQMKKLTLDYTVKNVTATATGLTVQGLTKAEVQVLLSEALLAYFTDNESTVSASVSSAVIKEANTLLYGMTIEDIVEWLEHIIDSVTVT